MVTDDMQTISPHFGRASHYLVYHVETGAITKKEPREKVAHARSPVEHHHAGVAPPEMLDLHVAMLANVKDCEVMIAAGMGRPMYENLRAAGMTVYITRERSADEAVKAFMDGSLDNHLELLH